MLVTPLAPAHARCRLNFRRHRAQAILMQARNATTPCFVYLWVKAWQDCSKLLDLENNDASPG